MTNIFAKFWNMITGRQAAVDESDCASGGRTQDPPLQEVVYDSDIPIEEVEFADTYIRVQEFQTDYPEAQQEKVDEYAELGEDNVFVYHEIYRYTGKKCPTPKPTTEDTPKVSIYYKAMCDFVNARKDLRRNMATGRTEWADKGTDDFVAIDNVQLDTMWTHLQDAEIPVLKHILQTWCAADRFPHYDPLADFMDSLPEWDGRDHAAELIRRVTDEGHVVEGMKIWLRAIAAKMMHWRDEQPWANMLMPLLVGGQGMHKTTFASMLLPVKGFFAQNINFTATKGDWAKKLTSYLLVCDDEFDKHTDRQLTTIKEALSSSELMFKEPYARNETAHTRLAALIGTSNHLDILRDETGSRRFIVVHVREDIDTATPIPYPQLYAQLKAELMSGEPYYPSKDFERQNEERNLTFRTADIVAELFFMHYRFSRKSAPEALVLTTTELYESLCRQHPTLRKEKKNSSEFGKSLKVLAAEYASQNGLNLDEVHYRDRSGTHWVVVKT